MDELLARLEQPNPTCVSCQGKGLLMSNPDMACPRCWQYWYQVSSAETLPRSKLLIMTSVMYHVLAERDSCDNCKGTGLESGTKKEACHCSVKAKAAIAVFLAEINLVENEVLWLTDEKDKYDLIWEVLDV